MSQNARASDEGRATALASDQMISAVLSVGDGDGEVGCLRLNGPLFGGFDRRLTPAVGTYVMGAWANQSPPCGASIRVSPFPVATAGGLQGAFFIYIEAQLRLNSFDQPTTTRNESSVHSTCPAKMAGATVRRSPYKDFLQPALQRRFATASLFVLAIAYFQALLLANWSSCKQLTSPPPQ